MEYLIDNIYVSIGNRVYRQCVGIPMGTDCAPLLANLFLFYYEKNLIKNNIILAKKFNNTMRYIDDLLTLNNNQFDAAIKDIRISSRTSVKKDNRVCHSTVIFRCTYNDRQWEIFNCGF